MTATRIKVGDAITTKRGTEGIVKAVADRETYQLVTYCVTKVAPGTPEEDDWIGRTGHIASDNVAKVEAPR